MGKRFSRTRGRTTDVEIYLSNHGVCYVSSLIQIAMHAVNAIYVFASTGVTGMAAFLAHISL